eukprot:comp20666_c1_seq1/m.26830 comp20666_c1_seq1/g.26830  ORF comp20666_c1_seq1/g.26830 comp20666_c1_seq1/m.26830 type:complete len:338 (-) comp20666_c1_seq1:331-1344(-)
MTSTEPRFPRKWEERPPQTNTGDATAPTVRVLCYNVLAQCYVKSAQFPESGSANLRWATRSKRLEAELARHNADILCLQEVDSYEPFWQPALTRLGYDGQSYEPRTMVRKGKQDGSGVFWRQSQFRLVESHKVHFNDVDTAPELLDLKADRPPDHFIRDCVASIVALEPTSPLPHATHPGIIVASAHLFWDPKCQDVKVAQAWWLLKCLAEFRQRHPTYPVMVAADFNGTHDSSHVQLMTNPAPVPDDATSAHFTPLAASTHLVPLLSAYPPDTSVVTNFTPDFRETIDHILHTPDIQVCGVPPLPKMQEFVDAGFKGFPSPNFPSDHLAIGCTFQL